MRSRRVTTSDIAKALGLSRATVSYALNETPRSGIPSDTVARVKAAALNMGYVPSAAAKQLRSGNSKLVLGILPSLDLGPSYPQIYAGMINQLDAAGYKFVLQSGAVTQPQIADLLTNITPALVVSLLQLPEDAVQYLSSAGILYHLTDLDAFVRRAARTQTEYMIKRGFTRLAYILPSHPMPDALTVPRIETMKTIAGEHGLPAPRILQMPYDEVEFETFRRKHLDAPNGPNGLCAHTDEVAATIYARLGRDRFGPNRIGLVGIGDRPISNIGITTVRLDIEKWASIWSSPLLRQLSDDAEQDQTTDETMFVVARASA